MTEQLEREDCKYPEQTDCRCCCVVVCPGHHQPPVPPPVPVKEKSCSSGSCVFEVRLQSICYVSGSPGWADNWAELAFTTHVDGNMSNYPSTNGSFIRLGKRGGAYWPGWMPVNHRAGLVEVPCECPRTIDVMTEMSEHPVKEKGLFSALLEGGCPWGASDVTSVVLRCGVKPAPITQEVQLQFGGNCTENLKMNVRYFFSQVTACTCCRGKERAEK